MRLLDVDTKSTQKPIYVVVCERYFNHYRAHAFIEPQSIVADRDEANHLAYSFSLADNCSYIVVCYNRKENRWQKA